MISVIREWIRRLIPTRLRRPIRTTQDRQERVDIVNRQYAAAARLARQIGSTPEELLDYRRADAILARGKQ